MYYDSYSASEKIRLREWRNYFVYFERLKCISIVRMPLPNQFNLYSVGIIDQINA